MPDREALLIVWRRVKLLVPLFMLFAIGCGSGATAITPDTSLSDADSDGIANDADTDDDGDGISDDQEIALRSDPTANDLLFVSKQHPNASDTNAGTLHAPLASLEAAFAKAQDSKIPITLLIAAGEYEAHAALQLAAIHQLLGGYSVDFSLEKSGFTTINFVGVSDSILVKIAPHISMTTGVPISLKHLIIRADDRTDYFFAIADADTSGFNYHGLTLDENEIHGNIAIHQYIVGDLVMRDNFIRGANGGEDNGYTVYDNTTVYFKWMAQNVEIARNQIFGGENVGEKIHGQYVLYLASLFARNDSDPNVSPNIVVEGNLFFCGETEICLGMFASSHHAGEQTPTLVVQDNTFRGTFPSTHELESSFTGLAVSAEVGVIQIRRNQIWIPDVRFIHGMSFTADVGAVGNPQYFIEENAFRLDFDPATASNAKPDIHLWGVIVHDAVGHFDFIGNSFIFGDLGGKIQLYGSSNPKEPVSINSDIEVVEGQF